MTITRESLRTAVVLAKFFLLTVFISLVIRIGLSLVLPHHWAAFGQLVGTFAFGLCFICSPLRFRYLRVRCRAVMADGMSIREASRVFGLHRDTVRKMLVFSVPPGYLRQSPPKRPKLEPFTGVIDRILEDDLGHPRKQRHTAKRIFERLREEYRFDGQYTIVKDYVREHRRQSREMFVPLSHAPGHASATSARPWWSSAEWSARPTASSSTCPTATAAS